MEKLGMLPVLSVCLMSLKGSLKFGDLKLDDPKMRVSGLRLAGHLAAGLDGDDDCSCGRVLEDLAARFPASDA
jgi:hypothetical protein